MQSIIIISIIIIQHNHPQHKNHHRHHHHHFYHYYHHHHTHYHCPLHPHFFNHHYQLQSIVQLFQCKLFEEHDFSLFYGVVETYISSRYYPIDSTTTTTIRATLNNNNNNCLSPTSIMEAWCLIISKLLTFLSVNTLLALLYYRNIIDCDSRYNRIDCELINRYDQLTHQSLCMETSDHYV